MKKGRWQAFRDAGYGRKTSNAEHRIKEVLLSQPGHRRDFPEPTVEQWSVLFRPDGLPSVLIRG
jgi:hypothetical protein